LNKLCELGWFEGLYERIYRVLSVDGMLPEPCSVQVIPPEALEVHGVLFSGFVLGVAFKGANTIWFPEQPPPPQAFAHELIHLIEGKDAELEEVYAYNLAALAVLLAERGIVPPANPVKLFNVTPEMVLEAVNSTYGYRFKDLVEYFTFKGVIPGFVDAEQGYKVREGFTRREIAVDAVSELIAIAGGGHDGLALEAIIELLKKAKATSN